MLLSCRGRAAAAAGRCAQLMCTGPWAQGGAAILSNQVIDWVASQYRPHSITGPVLVLLVLYWFSGEVQTSLEVSALCTVFSNQIS